MKVKLKNLRFLPPKTVEESLDLIKNVTVFLNIYLSKTSDWQLVNCLISLADADLWKTIEKHVGTKSGIPLSGVNFREIGVAGVLEAFAVFSRGLEEIELVGVSEHYCAGISNEALIGMYKDLQNLKQKAEMIETPAKMLSTIFSEALARSL